MRLSDSVNCCSFSHSPFSAPVPFKKGGTVFLTVRNRGKEAMMKRILATLITAVLGLSFVLGARAETILIDPGPLGTVSPYAQINNPFSNLNGTTLTGQSLSLDFTFVERKWIWTSGGAANHVIMDIRTNYLGTELRNGALPGDGYFFDEHGTPFPADPIILNATSLVSGGPEGWWAAIFYDRSMLTKPYKYFGIHLDFTLPDMPGIYVTSADLRQGGIDLINIPEPSTMLLLGSGLVGLVGIRVRSKRTKVIHA